MILSGKGEVLNKNLAPRRVTRVGLSPDALINITRANMKGLSKRTMVPNSRNRETENVIL